MISIQSLFGPPPRRFGFWFAATVFIAIGSYLLRRNVSNPAVEWMACYQLADFKTWGDFLTFFKQLHTGIPPILSMLEIATYLAFGSADLIIKHLFRLCFVLAFAIPFLGFARSRLQFALSLLTSFVFLWCSALVTAQNQQAYDVDFPLMLLLTLVCIRRAASATRTMRFVSFGAGAGLALSMMELLRPFGLILVPVLLVHAWIAFPKKRLAGIISLLVPLVLISGSWHLNLFFRHDGQIIWSNHGGHNLYRAWHSLMTEEPKVLTSTTPGYAKLNSQPFYATNVKTFGLPFQPDSEYHTINGRIYGRAAVKCIVMHPIEASRRVIYSIGRLLTPQIVVFQFFGDYQLPWEFLSKYAPKERIMVAYGPFVWLSAGFFFFNFLLLGAFIMRQRSLRIFAEAEPVILVTGVMTMLSFAIGETGEEARFLATLLPLFATYPAIFILKRTEGKTALAFHIDWLPARSLSETNDTSPPLQPKSGGRVTQPRIE